MAHNKALNTPVHQWLQPPPQLATQKMLKSSESSSNSSSSLKAIRNRIYAQRSRQRHRNYVNCLEQERELLLQRLERLEAENRAMRQLIVNGINNSNTSNNNSNSNSNSNEVSPSNTCPITPLPSSSTSTPIQSHSPMPLSFSIQPQPQLQLQPQSTTPVPSPSPVFSFSDFSHSRAGSSVTTATPLDALNSPWPFWVAFLVDWAPEEARNELMNCANGRRGRGMSRGALMRQQKLRNGMKLRSLRCLLPWSLSF